MCTKPQNTGGLNLIPFTWELIQCTPVTYSSSRTESCRAHLECGRTGCSEECATWESIEWYCNQFSLQCEPLDSAYWHPGKTCIQWKPIYVCKLYEGKHIYWLCGWTLYFKSEWMKKSTVQNTNYFVIFVLVASLILFLGYHVGFHWVFEEISSTISYSYITVFYHCNCLVFSVDCIVYRSELVDAV